MKDNLIWSFFKKNKLTYLAGLIFMLTASYIQTLFPKVLGETIDMMKESSFSQAAVKQNILYILLIALATFILAFTWRNLIIGNARKMECTFREELFRHFQRLSPTFYSKRKTGDLIAYASMTCQLSGWRLALQQRSRLMESLSVLLQSILWPLSSA